MRESLTESSYAAFPSLHYLLFSLSNIQSSKPKPVLFPVSEDTQVLVLQTHHPYKQMLEAKCLKKAVVPSTLIQDPSPGSLQCTRLALRVPFSSISSSHSLLFFLLLNINHSNLFSGLRGPKFLFCLHSLRSPHL